MCKQLCIIALLAFFATESISFYIDQSRPTFVRRNEELLSQLHRLENAIKNDDKEEVDKALQANSDLVDMRLPGQNLLPLELAIRIRSNNAFDELLDHNARVTTVNRDSEDTLVHNAVYYKNLHAVEKLLQKGLSAHEKNRVGKTPLHFVLWSDGMHESADFKASELIDLLVSRNPLSINAEDCSGATVLHYAVLHNKVDVVKELMKRRPDVYREDKHGHFALDYAMFEDNPELAQLILDVGNPYGWTMSAENILGLLNNSSNMSQKDLDESLVEAASRQRVKGMVIFLLKKGANVNARDQSKSTPLHSSMCWGHEDIVKVLLAAGADVNATNIWGETPLHCAIKHRSNMAIIKALRDAGADVNAKDQDGKTPLDLALRAERIQGLKEFFANDRDDKNSSANYSCVVQ